MTAVLTREQIITALPVTAHLAFYEGDDVFVDLVVTGPTGAPVDLSEAEARSQIRTKPGAPDVLAEFDATTIGNLVHLHLPTGATTGWTAECAVWDCQITLDGFVTTLAAGRVLVAAEVTR